jgi:hypothetical protein
VGTATFVNPRALLLVARQLEKLMRQLRIESVESLVGTLQLPQRKDSEADGSGPIKSSQPVKMEQ